MKAESTPDKLADSQRLEQHQVFLSNLMKSNQTQQAIQSQWQAYYNRLDEADKLALWEHAQNQADAEPVVAEEPDHPLTPDHQVEPPTSTAELKNYQNDPRADKRQMARFRDFFSVPLAIKKYNRWQASHRRPPAVAMTPGAEPVADATNITEILPDKRLSSRARSTLTWNSPTAMFDKGETMSIWRQNIKSIVFGLSVGVLVFAVHQFAFFNERYLEPFIQPSTLSNNSPIIVTPGASKIDDPSFKIILPKINVEAPVVDGVTAYRSQNPNEPEALFQARMQSALERGVVHFPTSQLPGQSGKEFNSNAVILGHSGGNIFTPGNYKHIFTRLKQLDIGDIFFVNYDRTQYVYKVYKKQVVAPNQVEVLRKADRNNSMTVITCDPPGSSAKRLVIVGEQINPNPDDNLGVLAPSETQDIIIPSNSRTLRETIF